MAGFGGFNFGGKPSATATTATGGLSFTTSTPAAGVNPTPGGGFGLGTTPLGIAPQATTPATGFSLSALSASTAGTPATGFGLGGTQASTASTGFKLGGTPAASTGFSLGAGTAGTAGSTGFNLGGTATTVASTGFNLAGTATTVASTGFGLGGVGATTTTPSTGFSLGGTPATTKSVGFNLTGTVGSTTAGTGLLGATPSLGATPVLGVTPSTAPPAYGFSKPLSAVGGTATTSSGFGVGLGGGLKLGATATTTGATFGGLSGFLATGSTAGATGGSIFGQAVAKTTSSGLGGVDPKTTTTTASDPSKTGDGKTVKETMVENNILLDVDEFRKFVKEEKSEMEQMKRMSSTPMMKVQEDNTALRQLLSLVSSGLQRNACAVDKLKKEMTQELKSAEMAIRTKETPPGLQYENTAPMHYFQSVIESFETQMLQYRQQIEMLENHLASIHQPSRLTPEELILLLRKLHEAFVAMAAQLQQIHEAVKTQKEHYLSYRKVFHGDNRNIFERQKKAPVKVTPVTHTDVYGQPPFPGINNAAAVAMASALTRSQQPQPQAGAPPVSGFSNFQPSTGFGASTVSGFPSFGATTTQAAGFKGFGSGTAGGLFGNTSNLATTQAAGSLFSSPLPGAGGGGLPQPNLAAGTDQPQPFQLNKPPVGSKRGKR